jgi:16S rRNA (adenine1518-N6/adenine1519-N6)-dimethyltransferase
MQVKNEYPYLSKLNIQEFLKNSQAGILKKWGQNFLIDPNILRQIIYLPSQEKIFNSEIICEIGPGLGALTHILVTFEKPVVLFEIDPILIKHLKSQQYFSLKKITLIEGDVLKNLNSISNYKAFVYGNLPYYISSEILLNLMKTCPKITGGVFLLQKEFVERITKSHSSISIFLKAFGIWKMEKEVSANCFYPKPEATSAILSFLPYNQPKLTITELETLEILLRAFFWGKRKTLLKILNSSPFIPNLSRELWKEIFLQHCNNLYRRPEELTEEEYYTLARLCSKV